MMQLASKTFVQFTMVFSMFQQGVRAELPQIVDTPTGRAINEIVSALGAGGFSGVVLAAKDGDVIAVSSAGTTGENKDSVETDALFEIASTTKSFTAMAIVLLHKRGRLNLDRSITEYLPAVPEDCKGITVRHLLQHTSGIPSTNTHGGGDDLKKVVPKLLRGGPVQTPGNHYQYWNQGYALLSGIVDRVSDQSYTEFIAKEIFKPCGMTSSCFTGDDAPAGMQIVVGQSIRGDPRSALEHPYRSYGYQYRGTGGLVSNVWDMWRFDRAIKDESLVSAEEFKHMITPPASSNYGLGWRIAKVPGGPDLHHHSGSVRGFLADFRRYPSIDGCLVVLSNNDESAPFLNVVKACERVLVDAKPLIPAELLAKTVGTYEDDKGRRMVIRDGVSDPQVLIIWPGNRKSAGHLEGDDPAKLTFAIPTISKTYTVSFNISGDRADGCNMLGMQFHRVDSR